MKDAPAFRQAIDELANRLRSAPADLVIGMESRGFIFAAPIAYLLGLGFVPVRKLGKLPGQVISKEILAFIEALDTREIHGYRPELGFRVFTDEALAEIKPTATAGGAPARIAAAPAM